MVLRYGWSLLMDDLAMVDVDWMLVMVGSSVVHWWWTMVSDGSWWFTMVDSTIKMVKKDSKTAGSMAKHCWWPWITAGLVGVADIVSNRSFLRLRTSVAVAWMKPYKPWGLWSSRWSRISRSRDPHHWGPFLLGNQFWGYAIGTQGIATQESWLVIVINDTFCTSSTIDHHNHHILWSHNK